MTRRLFFSRNQFLRDASDSPFVWGQARGYVARTTLRLRLRGRLLLAKLFLESLAFFATQPLSSCKLLAGLILFARRLVGATEQYMSIGPRRVKFDRTLQNFHSL